MPPVIVVNIKAGMPSAADASAHLVSAVTQARRSGVRVLKVVHGYGSSGAGGGIKTAVRTALDRMHSRGEITAFFCADAWGTAALNAADFLDAEPTLARDRDLLTHNPGLTLVLLPKKTKGAPRMVRGHD